MEYSLATGNNECSVCSQPQLLLLTLLLLIPPPILTYKRLYTKNQPQLHKINWNGNLIKELQWIPNLARLKKFPTPATKIQILLITPNSNISFETEHEFENWLNNLQKTDAHNCHLCQYNTPKQQETTTQICESCLKNLTYQGKTQNINTAPLLTKEL